MDGPNLWSVSFILSRKAEGRRDAASRSFIEKLEILEAMRKRVEPIRMAREARRKKGSEVQED